MSGVGVVSPFASCEVRWFLDGDSTQHAETRRWFTDFTPFAQDANVGRPQWQGRLGGEPDVYLLLPNYTDTGIKWREGVLQIKGLVQELGPTAFTGGHEGRVERWLKWTYENLPPAYQAIVEGDIADSLITVSVRKVRALRMLRLDSQPKPTEVPPGVMLERGLGFELTDLEIAGKRYCSAAFEAFPDDAPMPAEFIDVVGRFLEGLKDTSLTIEQSMSYPSWLLSMFGINQQAPQSPESPGGD